MRSLTLALVLAAPAPAQEQLGRLELPRTGQLLDRIAGEFPDDAHLVVAVDGTGRRFVKAVGSADPTTGRPFEDWCLVPLGALTREFLHEVLVAAVERGAFAWQHPIGKLLPEVDATLRSRSWSELTTNGATVVPNYLRWVESGAAARPLARVIAEHAFRPIAATAYADRTSMLRAALLQSAVERVLDRPWSETLKQTARALGARSLRAGEPSSPLLGVARHDSDGDPIALRSAEIPAAGAATGTAQDVAALLRTLLRREPRAAGQSPDHPFRGWVTGTNAAFGETYIARSVDTPGVTGTVRVYHRRDLAVFTFTNRARSRNIHALQHEVLVDLLGEPETDVSSADFGFGGAGVAVFDPKLDGLWAATLRLDGASVLLQLDIRRATVRLRAPTGAIEVERLSRGMDTVDGSLRIPAWERDGHEQRTTISLERQGDDLTGFVSHESRVRDVGLIDQRPYPLEFERAADEVERLPLVKRRRRR